MWKDKTTKQRIATLDRYSGETKVYGEGVDNDYVYSATFIGAMDHQETICNILWPKISPPYDKVTYKLACFDVKSGNGKILWSGTQLVVAISVL